MHSTLVFVHSLLRWVVILFAVAAISFAIRGLAGKREFAKQDNRIGLLFTISLDLQVLLGLLMYFVVSPTTVWILDHFKEAMKDRELRFWAVEHATAMILALVLVHVGRVMVRRAETPKLKHRRALIFFGIGTLVMLAGIPWPFLPYGRELLHLPQ